MTPLADDQFERTIFSPAMAAEATTSSDLGHYLVSVGDADPGTRVEIGSVPITIGRDARQTLVFAEDTQVSRVHARVSLAGGQVVAEDLGSTNGTFVDAERITAPVPLREGNVLRVGRHVLKYERRKRADVQRAEQISRDLRRASRYVLSLLPAPLTTGPVLTDWKFYPCAQLGGDAFGYYWLDADTFVFYLVDVSGHGAGSAMHSVTVLNLLRQRVLPNVDFRDPAEVLSSLNARFEMANHSGMFFTMWYGVYRASSRSLSYSSAGHHPAYLVPPDRSAAQPLGMSSLMIGALPNAEYEVHHAAIPRGSTLYLFSDGAFEIVTKDDQQWALSDFLPFILEPPIAGTAEPERLYRLITEKAKSGHLDDDFSLLVVTCRRSGLHPPWLTAAAYVNSEPGKRRAKAHESGPESESRMVPFPRSLSCCARRAAVTYRLRQAGVQAALCRSTPSRRPSFAR